MKGEQTRQRILDSATELFWARNYHGVSVADVAEVASVNKATLYQYFQSKDVLVQSVVSSSREWTVEHIFDSAFADSKDPMIRLRCIYKRVHVFHQCIFESHNEVRGCPFVNIAMELAVDNELVRMQVVKTFEQFSEYYRTIVRDYRGKRIAKTKVDRLVRALLGNMNGAMVASRYERRPDAILDALPIAELLVKS
ncbi:MAG: helix-turn-helix domain-containing protein [Granulosicoccus sp.]